MISKNEVQKWSREDLEERFLEIDSRMDDLEAKFYGLREYVKETDRLSHEVKRLKEKNNGLINAILTLSNLLLETRSLI